MTNLDPKHLDALVERQRQIAILHRGIIESRKDTIRGPLSLSDADHRELIADASRAADAITDLRAENDRLSNLWQIEHDHATALRAQIDRERAATIEAAAKAINDRGAEEQRNFGLGRETQNFYRARDIVRALHTDATRAAMDAIRREAREQALREAAVVCVSLRKEEGRPEDECIGCMDCASAILALAASDQPPGCHQPPSQPADRYGRRKVTRMYADVEALRRAIRSEGTPAVQEAWDAVEEHIDYAYRPDDKKDPSP